MDLGREDILKGTSKPRNTRWRTYLEITVPNPRLLLFLFPVLVFLPGCSDSAGPGGSGHYKLSTVNGDPVPAILTADTVHQVFSIVDSASIDLITEDSGRIALVTHGVWYQPGGDSLTDYYGFRLDARVTRIPGAVILDYRAPGITFPITSDFQGVDTARFIQHGLIILGDSVSNAPRTSYRYKF